MSESARERARVSRPILLISAAVWVLLVVDPGSTFSIAHCPVTDAGASPASFRMLLAMNPVSSLAADWALMLAAMMLPTLITPIRHVLDRSFKRRRPRAVALFLLGYTSIWMAAGSVLVAAQLALSVLAPHSYLPAFGVGLIAFVWQCSPLKQRCLNRGHNHSELAAFGIAADLDALRFGVAHGVWCVGSGWAVMLFPMLLPRGHSAAMAAVTVLMISEHLEAPRAPSWRLRGPGKLLRIIGAQSRIRLQGLRSVSARPSSGT